MILYPAIDLKDGQCVRLVRGEMTAATVFNDHFDHQVDVFGQRRNHVILVDDFNIGIRLNVATRDHACFIGFNRDHTSRFAVVAYNKTLHVQDDLSDVFDDTGNRSEFVLSTTDLDLSNSTAHQAGKQDAAKAISNAGTKAALERFSRKLSVHGCQGVAIDFQVARKFHSSPSDVH